jgi:heptosyltransferase II
MKILIIQTASIGDVILVTPMLEAIRHQFPEASTDLLIKQGMAELFHDDPRISRCLVWNKKSGKYLNLFRLIRTLRRNRYDHVIAVQRFLSAGLLALFSGGRITAGFDKNPMSQLFTHRVTHTLSDSSQHEVDRNIMLLQHLGISGRWLPKLHISRHHYAAMEARASQPYICIAPSSLWVTKQYPESLWKEFLDGLPAHYNCYIVGSKDDIPLATRLCNKTTHAAVMSVAGLLSLPETAALMANASMNYTNDSAPLHLASATNAPVTAIFCSTIPAFGFGPLSDHSHILEAPKSLPCRPCGVHGRKACPEKHFDCANLIKPKDLLSQIPDQTYE